MLAATICSLIGIDLKKLNAEGPKGRRGRKKFRHILVAHCLNFTVLCLVTFRPFLFFSRQVFLCSPDCPGTTDCPVCRPGWPRSHRDPPPSISQV